MTVLFWASIFLVAYTYLGYPLVVWAFGKVRPRDVRKGSPKAFVQGYAKRKLPAEIFAAHRSKGFLGTWSVVVDSGLRSGGAIPRPCTKQSLR